VGDDKTGCDVTQLSNIDIDRRSDGRKVKVANKAAGWMSEQQVTDTVLYERKSPASVSAASTADAA
jgi:hypothetical protein